MGVEKGLMLDVRSDEWSLFRGAVDLVMLLHDLLNGNLVAGWCKVVCRCKERTRGGREEGEEEEGRVATRGQTVTLTDGEPAAAPCIIQTPSKRRGISI
jgi:hypothetical protein